MSEDSIRMDSVKRLENSIEYRVYSEEKKENKRFVIWLLTNRRTGVPRFHEDRPACLCKCRGSIHRIRFGSDKSNPYRRQEIKKEIDKI